MKRSARPRRRRPKARDILEVRGCYDGRHDAGDNAALVQCHSLVREGVSYIP